MNASPGGGGERNWMDDHVRAAVPLDRGLQAPAVFVDRLEGVHRALLAHQAGAEHGEEADVRTHVPEGHPRAEQLRQRPLDGRLVQPRPQVFLRPRVDQQADSLRGAGTDVDPGRSGRR